MVVLLYKKIPRGAAFVIPDGFYVRRLRHIVHPAINKIQHGIGEEENIFSVDQLENGHTERSVLILEKEGEIKTAELENSATERLTMERKEENKTAELTNSQTENITLEKEEKNKTTKTINSQPQHSCSGVCSDVNDLTEKTDKNYKRRW
ncbi:hypothetical protein FQR65_LT09049 [Abscondita terminalis]|nr:hypothetical protein FQR65_LT09049 [Abscondita terminalis]